MASREQDSVGIVAFSFASRPEYMEPNPCNRRLAQNVERISRELGRPMAIVAQWEIAKALRSTGIEPDLVVDLEDSGAYLDSESVWEAAELYFRVHDVRQVVPVAQPFLQLKKIRGLIRKGGFSLIDGRVKNIGFDRSASNNQWWTRGPIRLAVYALRQSITGTRGHGGRQVPA